MSKIKMPLVSLAAAVLGGIAALAFLTAPSARPAPVPLQARLASCTWTYHYSISTLAAGGAASLWITNSTCGSGWPKYRAQLNCAYTKPGLGTYNAYGAWVRPSATSRAQCNSSSVPNWLDENLIFYNGTTATYRDWTR